MEDRVQKFHSEALSAKTLAPNKAHKAMLSFQKFLFKSQDAEFTEREKSKLFGTVECYFSLFDRAASEQKQFSAKSLLEDALKVPTFQTKQKKSMLKWLNEIEGVEDSQQEKSKPKHVHHSNSDDEEWDEGDWGEEEEQ